MGKRERRRRRERARQQAADRNIAADLVTVQPSEEDPHLKVIVAADASSEVRSMCVAYWALAPDGAWKHAVPDPSTTATVSANSYAVALRLACSQCGRPVSVRTRRQLARLQSPGRRCASCTSSVVPRPTDGEATTSIERNDEAEPQALIPRPVIEPVPEAPEELVTLGRRYWEIVSRDPNSACVAWRFRAASLEGHGWGKPHVAAAAGVRAILPDRSCRRCGGPLTLTSRWAYQQLFEGGDPGCVDCTPRMQDALRRLHDPEHVAERTALQEQAQRARTEQDIKRQWSAQQREAIRERYPVRHLQEAPIPHAGVRTELTALALLRYATSANPLGPVDLWEAPLLPEPQLVAGAVAETVRAGLLAVHPDSVTGAFTWEEPRTAEEALARAGGDLDAVGQPELSDRYYPTRAAHYSPYGSSLGTGAAALDAHLIDRLNPARMTLERQHELLGVLVELIAREAMRYFDYQLQVRHLPAVPDTHFVRLRDATERAAEALSLGEINNLAWRAAVRAADAAQIYPGAPRANMSTHAVNRFEAYVQDAVGGGLDYPLKPYTNSNVELSAATRTLFYTVLDKNPVTTSRADAEREMPPAVPSVAPGGDTSPDTVQPLPLDTSLAWLRRHPEDWTPEGFIAYLQGLQNLDDGPETNTSAPVLAEAAMSLATVWRDLSGATGDARAAALGAASAARLMTTPVTYDLVSGYCGQWIIDGFVTESEARRGRKPGDD
ncbi:hypothetical protein [Streptomyces sp. NPDC007264]|uniref:hypothetical protein n=1 Tax=Streptomyces sp. NPDC007264 TaxID=3364777 RepID=UPI0036DCF904